MAGKLELAVSATKHVERLLSDFNLMIMHQSTGWGRLPDRLGDLGIMLYNPAGKASKINGVLQDEWAGLEYPIWRPIARFLSSEAANKRDQVLEVVSADQLQGMVDGVHSLQRSLPDALDYAGGTWAKDEGIKLDERAQPVRDVAHLAMDVEKWYDNTKLGEI